MPRNAGPRPERFERRNAPVAGGLRTRSAHILGTVRVRSISRKRSPGDALLQHVLTAGTETALGVSGAATIKTNSGPKGREFNLA